MITRYKLSPASVEALRWQSVSLADVARRARLPRELLCGPEALLTVEQLTAFWEAVGEVSGDPAIGLRLGADTRVERLCVASLAALSAGSFRDALARLARYNRLTCPEDIRVTTRGLERAVRLNWQLASPPSSILGDMSLAWVAALADRGTAGAVRPIRVELSHTRNKRLYERHFGCAVRLTKSGSALFFRTADLDRRFETHNEELLRLLVPQLDAELAARESGDDTRDWVKAVLCRSLTGRRPDLRIVARELASSRRTLQRRLAALGVSFHQLLEEARRDSANHYLVFSTLELSQIAYLLGYKDTNSFVRAFGRWEGIPPGRWRETRRAEVQLRARSPVTLAEARRTS